MSAGCTVHYMKGMCASRILCTVNLYRAADNTYYSVVHITDWHMVKRKVEEGGRGGTQRETMHVHECGCGWWFTKTEMVWIWLIGLCYLYHVLWKPCHSWLDIFILNLTFMVQSMLEGGGRTWELGECMVLEISYDIHLRVKDQFCWLDRISATLPAAYLQNQCCSFDQSCYFV